MPTYDYKCENCGTNFEIFQSIKDEPLKLCEKCGHESLVKMVSVPAGLIFKGSGFYLTDYVKKNSSSSAGTGNKETPAAENPPKKEAKKSAKPKSKDK